jgi:hypothetical protein
MVAEKVHADAELDEKDLGKKVGQMGGKAKDIEKEDGLAGWKGGSRRRKGKSKGKSLRRKKMTMKQRQQQQRQQRQQQQRRRR